MTQTITPCPSCGAPLASVAGYPVWCSGCDWGLDVAEPRRRGLRERFDRWSSRKVEALYEEVARSPAERPGWDAARLASYGPALCVHLFTVALIAFAIWVLAAMRTPVLIFFAVLALLVAWALLPRFGSLRKMPDVRRRPDASALFALLDRVAAELGVRPVDAVVVSGDFNAAYGTVGLRRHRVLLLGLPLWESLTAQQKVALLGHEFAHGANGDSRHGVVVGTSLSTLVRLRALLRPGPPDDRLNYLIDLCLRAMQGVASSLVGSVLVLQHMVTLRAGQRAEYLADRLAARLASPEAAAGMLETLVIAEDTHLTAIQRHMLTGRKTGYWDDLRDALARLPASERERRLRAAARRRLRVDQSHPPTHLRIAVVRGLPAAAPALLLEPDEEQQIRAALTADYALIARRLHDDARERLG
ncbi:M48 family metallopeptidase [Actinomadura sp. BRA 177]|uniref:M48 family metallopeptidase n=1 Tax=Actinomadura sp. BRA 177 TaxID=2745202 RepID=UPI001595B151|nr:M48 family metallopeptidase [Actinomadura sp. BRA 177]NVI87766.1 M48 family metalloprotease [Actinomadura sp. BRA 177]